MKPCYRIHRDYWASLKESGPDWAVYAPCALCPRDADSSDHMPIACFAKRSHAVLFAAMMNKSGQGKRGRR